MQAIHLTILELLTRVKGSESDANETLLSCIIVTLGWTKRSHRGTQNIDCSDPFGNDLPESVFGIWQDFEHLGKTSKRLREEKTGNYFGETALQ